MKIIFQLKRQQQVIHHIIIHMNMKKIFMQRLGPLFSVTQDFYHFRHTMNHG